MQTWQKVLVFVVALAAVFGVAVGIGLLAGPIDTDDEAHDAGHDDERVHLDPVEGEGGHGGGRGDAHDTAYELALDADVVDSGRVTVAFRILDEAGEPVTSYDVEHEKRLHLIAVRRDLAEYRHVHPRLDAATGRWTVPIALGAGSWRLYADFAPTGAEPVVAEAELMVAGRFAPAELGPDTTTARVDGYEVHLERDDAGSMVTFHVTREGAEVTDLQPYLGSYGHLVAIRAEDLAYLHVHPEEGPAGPEVGFHAEFAESGRYRLFLDFKHGGRVHTADFTISADAADSEQEEHGEEGGGHDH
ncbi:hypothetical protein [Nocardioides bizhenqiangii]|uniref:Heavy metal-binding domain-containing protein n=1 Tax=Nocardioides bizhenqiangii TaxID=3095076 RepID=A0ABZ0ZNR6_9ACTN|nr:MULTISPECIES: hypothetical protein [unclassified Nocardioides]MDZ5619976.1 hypothetical protein [Nocardioides sp. HM23]WQQ26021.1 hypothetical protein SHK19_18885 [Nocardioides sp. HM61]